MAKRKSPSDHDKLVVKAAESLNQNSDFKNIQADVKGYSTPSEINWKGDESGHIPDLKAVGTKTSKEFIFEVETDDSISDNHTEDQWRLFAAYAKQNNGVFYVIVPKGSKQKAESRLKDLELEGKVWAL